MVENSCATKQASILSNSQQRWAKAEEKKHEYAYICTKKRVVPCIEYCKNQAETWDAANLQHLAITS
jgi:hypothetical protein